MSATNPVFARAVLDYIFGDGANGFAPASYGLALSTADPGTDGSGFTEPVAGDYSRAVITNNSTNFPAATLVGGLPTKNNGASFSFSEATSSWGLVSYWGLYGVIDSVEILTVFGPLTDPKTVSSGETLRILLGDMAITLT